MSIWNRIRINFRTEVTRLLDQVENHEAVADELLGKARQQLAAAETRLVRLQREREQLDQQQRDAVAKAEQWQTRAVQNATANQELALQCLQRKKAAAELARQREEELVQLDGLVHEVEQELDESRRLIGELNRRKQALAARDLSQRAQQDSRAASGDEELGRLLDRWEEQVRVRELERPMGRGKPVDRLEQQFREEEERDALARELAELKSNLNQA
ncbi:MAG: PspA/IM30 family protein [Verrucomicrobiota bacterium JB022]|nr:PspA/IM30 family protein [Verrucomicrobiota bacterium JB022]